MNTFAALADPTRQQIVEDLARSGQMSASDIASHFAMSKPAVSQHLKVLKSAGLIEMEIRAQFRMYRLRPEALEEIAAWSLHTRMLWSKSANKPDTAQD